MQIMSAIVRSLLYVMPSQLMSQPLLLLFGSLSTSLFIPLMANNSSTYSNHYNAELEQTVRSTAVQFTAACSIAACAPLLFELMLDSIFARSRMMAFRWVGIASLITFNVALLASINSNLCSLIIISFSYWQIFVQVCLICWMLLELDTYNIWSLTSISSLVVSYFLLICVYYIEDMRINAAPLAITILKYVLGLVCFTQFAYRTCLWLIALYKQYRASSMKFSEWCTKLSYNDYAMLAVHMASTSLMPFYTVFVLVGMNGQSSSSPAMLIAAITLRSCMSLLSAILPGRVFQAEAGHTTAQFEVKHNFIKYISHNLRTPINVLNMGLEVATLQLFDTDDPRLQNTHKTLKELSIPCSAALDILDDVLLYVQLETADHVHVFPTSERPMKAFREFCRPVQLESYDHGIDLKLSCTDEASKRLLIQIDLEKMGGVFERLLRAALYNRERGDVINICVSSLTSTSVKRSRSARLRSVQPIGISNNTTTILRVSIPLVAAFPNEDLQVIKTGTFQFTRSSHGYTGSGFGLHFLICKKLLLCHGGDICVEENDGIELCIDLPCFLDTSPQRASGPPIIHNASHSNRIQALSRKAHRPAMYEVQNDEAVADANDETVDSPAVRRFSSKSTKFGSAYYDRKALGLPPLKSEKGKRHKDVNIYHLLIVDDSNMNRKIMIKLMEALGHMCDEANDGSVAVEMMKKSNSGSIYDAVLLDNEMPIMKGRDAARHMKDMGFRGLILGVTGNVTDEDIDDFTKNGADLVIKKPLTVQSFQSAMRTLVRPVASRDNFDVLIPTTTKKSPSAEQPPEHPFALK